MRPGLIRQHILPLWLLRGFGRGEAEAAETTWSYTPEQVTAARLRDAGATASSHRPIYAGLLQAMAGGSRSFSYGARSLRGQPAGPAGEPPGAIGGLVIWIALRTHIARTVIAAHLLAQVPRLLARGQRGDATMADVLDLFADLDHFRTEVLAVAAGNRTAYQRSIAADGDGVTDGAPDDVAAMRRRRRAVEAEDPDTPMAGLEHIEQTYQRHHDWLCRATFTMVDFPPHSLILSDSAVVRWDAPEAAFQAYSFADAALPNAVVLPLAADRLLVGTCEGSTQPPDLTAAAVNRASARGAREFFVASANRDEFADLRPLILAGERAKNDGGGDWLVRLLESDMGS